MQQGLFLKNKIHVAIHVSPVEVIPCLTIIIPEHKMLKVIQSIGILTLRDIKLRFKTDNGVFSKREVDFGSRLLVETFQMPDLSGDILDVGCGYGPIGLSIAKTWPERKLHMMDVNARALATCKR